MTETSYDLEAGLLEEIFNQLPRSTRDHLLFNFATAFNNDASLQQCQTTLDILSTLSTLNLGFSRQPSEIEKWFSLRHLPLTGLRQLSFSETQFDPDSEQESRFLSFLAECPIFNTIEKLTLVSCALTNIGPLVRGPNIFPKLKSLHLTSNYDLDILPLATTAAFPNLKDLDIRYIALTPETATALSQSNSFCCELTELLLDTTELSTDSITLAILRSPFCTGLKSLSIGLIDPDKVFKVVADECLLTFLEKLTFEAGAAKPPLTNLSDYFSSPTASNLVEIDFSGINSLSPGTIEAFATSPHLDKLKRVCQFPYSSLLMQQHPDLKHKIVSLRFPSDSRLTMADINFMSTAACFSKLEELLTFDMQVLDENGKIDPQVPQFNRAIQTLIQSPNLVNLTKLGIFDFRHPGLTAETLDMLFQSPQLSQSLTRLWLWGQKELNESHFAQLGQQPTTSFKDPSVVPKFTKLEDLNLMDCNLGASSVMSLCQLENLNTLDLSGNRLSDQDLLSLISLDPLLSAPSHPVPHLSRLTHIKFDFSRITSAGFEALAKSPVLEQLQDFTIAARGADFKGLMTLFSAPQASNLEYLWLLGCPHPKEEIEEKVKKAHPNCVLFQF